MLENLAQRTFGRRFDLLNPQTPDEFSGLALHPVDLHSTVVYGVSRGGEPPADEADAPLSAPPPSEPPVPPDPAGPPFFARRPRARDRRPYLAGARADGSQVHSHVPGERTASAAGGVPMLTPVNRRAMPSRSTRQTIASTVRVRQRGGRK